MHYGKGSHNIYLNASAETGIVGLLLLLVAVCSQLLSANREAHSGAKSEGISIVPYEAACWAMLVAGFFLDVLWRKDFWFVWILLAIAIRAKRNELSESLS
jgi:O-antigen ligase